MNPLEGGSIIEELPSALGVLLWQRARDVRLWVGTPPGQRQGLFPWQSTTVEATEAELHRPLGVLARMISAPSDIAEEEVGEACSAVARWAERSGYGAIALSYRVSAALTRPQDSRAAYEAGRVARDQGDWSSAESWLNQARELAGQRGEYDAMARALIGLGNLYRRRGNLPQAEAWFQLGLRLAIARRRRLARALAHHELAALLTHMGRYEESDQHAHAAALAYPKGHPMRARLVNDVAFRWMERGYFARALPVFEAVLPHLDEPASRMGVLANIARAAGAIGNRVRFSSALADAGALDGAVDVIRAESWLDFARGAVSLGDRTLARTLALRAIRDAEAVGEHRVVLQAEAVVASEPDEPRFDCSNHDPLGASLVATLTY